MAVEKIRTNPMNQLAAACVEIRRGPFLPFYAWILIGVEPIGTEGRLKLSFAAVHTSNRMRHLN